MIFDMVREAGKCEVAVSREGGDIDADKRRAIDKASPFRFESKIRIWELERPQIDGTMVDVLESGKDTGGGSLDMHERLAKGGPGTIRFSRSSHTSSHPTACGCKVLSYLPHTDHGIMGLGTGLYFDS